MRGGEVSQSARSITSSLLSKLYQKNMEFTIQPLSRLHYLENSEDPHWGGARLCMMLQCIYTIAFLCLLRFDEVLRIELKDIEVVDKLKRTYQIDTSIQEDSPIWRYIVLPPSFFINQKSNLSISSSTAKNLT